MASSDSTTATESLLVMIFTAFQVSFFNTVVFCIQCNVQQSNSYCLKCQPKLVFWMCVVPSLREPSRNSRLCSKDLPNISCIQPDRTNARANMSALNSMAHAFDFVWLSASPNPASIEQVLTLRARRRLHGTRCVQTTLTRHMPVKWFASQYKLFAEHSAKSRI